VRALTIAAAGHHNPDASGIGPPGSGKTVALGASTAHDLTGVVATHRDWRL